MEHYAKAVKLDPNLAQAHNNLGVIYLQKGRPADGAAQLREALRLNPQDRETEYNLARALGQQSQWVEAATLFGKAVGASADPIAHFEFATALAHLGNIREARSQYASALLARPDFPEALDGLSWMLATSTNADYRNGAEAVRMAERACELTERKDPAKLKTLAAAYAEAGRFPEAIATAQRAADLAADAGQKGLAAECGRLLESFSETRAWRKP